MFKMLNKQGVESDQGFAVQITGRFTCEYCEGSRILELEIEFGYEGTKPCVMVKASSFSVWGAEQLSSQRQEQIIKNFKEAMEFQGLELIVD
jgi:hypothetical protein